MDFRRDSSDAYIINIIQAHVQVLGDVVIVATGNKAQLVLSVVNGHGVRVEGIVCLTDQLQLGSNLQMFECLTAIPLAESSDVEIV